MIKYFVLLPEALIVAFAVAVVVAGRFAWMPRPWRSFVPHAAVVVVLAALGVELWAGASGGSYFGGALLQDRFALFVKAIALVAAGIVIACSDWVSEDSAYLGVAMPLLAAFGVMVAASAADLVGLWAGLELVAVAGVVLVALRRPDLGLRLLVAGGIASTLLLIGLVFIYATTGNADLSGIRAGVTGEPPTVAVVIPLLLLIAGLAIRAGVAPFHVATLPVGLGASPIGAALVVGMAAVAAGVVALKLTAALLPIGDSFATFLQVVAAIAMLAGGAAALAVRSPRPRMAYIAVSQLGWLAAGLATHFRSGVGSSLFLLGAFALAATCGPAVMGRAEGGEPAIFGFGVLRPLRALGFSLALLSLAGAPPLPGFFGELSVAAALAQSHNFVLLGLGLVGAVLCVFAAVGTLRAVYMQSPLEESRRGAAAALPGMTALSSLGAVVLGLVLAAYVVFGFPIMGLADQGAEALGLR
ncbi:MAG TPA: proton-conducting transporter membrane subunit [Candidatus Dormibacteraeota bacterium]|nr:proton-conducting transporter membrane subunit [Candidatus Dormibacteraeota bacterium]